MPDTPTTLDDWLALAERQHPQTIALGLDRVRRVRDRMGFELNCPVVTVAGTNGKGSTCAMLEAILLAAGYRVGVYTSPHLVDFEERCRINGASIAASDLLPHFAEVEAARKAAGGPDGTGEQLTYFEFTTLVILAAMAEQALDVVILEVGMGGRLDAVNVIDTDCAIVTSIDIDHTQFLGADREAIGFEKAGIFRAGKPAIVCDPQPPASVIAHAQSMGADLRRFGVDFRYTHLPQQWGWEGGGRRYSGLAWPALRGANQLLNASGALAALDALRDRLPVTAQAVRTGFSRVELPGRFQVLAGQPTLILDVGHNPHAVAVLAENLDAMGYFPVTRAVFGAMGDKDLAGMFLRIAPLIDQWFLCDLPISRAASAADLHSALLAVRPEAVATCAAGPREALALALEQSDPADRIVVFGSFHTVGGVLRGGLPRLQGQHLGTSSS